MSTVLIVEDNLLLAECYTRWLTAGGYDVRCAIGAQAALDELDDELPDVLLVDILLHGANGIQLLQTLRSHSDFFHIPVVLCSSVVPSTLLPSLRAYGVLAVLDKSTLTRRRLAEAVGKALNEATV